MHLDAKMRRLRDLCRRPAMADDDLLAIARLVELTEYAAGAVAAPAGVGGRWRTRVLSGTVATTAPTALCGEGAVLSHGPETAVVAVTDVVLLTTAERDSGALDALVPGLFGAAECESSEPRRRLRLSRSQAAAAAGSGPRRQGR
jgi:hypothetical protein